MIDLKRGIGLTFVAATFALAVDGSCLARSGESGWESYTQASKMFEQGGSYQEIRRLCRAARKTSDDPILSGRASLLLARLHVLHSDLAAAHRVLREMYLTAGLPASFQDEARLRDARLFYREDDRAQAMALSQHVANTAANPFLRHEALISLARIYADDANWQKSDSLLNYVTSRQPVYARNDERVPVLQARYAMAHGDAAAAINLLAGRKSQMALIRLAQAYEMADKPMMAVGIYKKIHDRAPRSAQAQDALFQAGEVFMRSGDWLAARNEFSQFLLEFPKAERRAAVEFRLGWIYLQLGKTDEALNVFSNASSEMKSNYFSYMEGEALRRQGAFQPDKYREAIVAYNRVAALRADSRLGRMSKLRVAMTLLEKGETEDAVIGLRQFRALYPKDELAPVVTFLLATNSPPETRGAYFQEFLHKKWSGAVRDAAVAFLQKQDYDRGDYQSVIRRNARVAPGGSGRSQTYWQRMQRFFAAESAYYLRHYMQARKMYVSVFADAGDDLSQQAALGRAWCLLQTGKPDSAANAFEAIRSRYPGETHLRASFGLATTYYRMQQFEKAIQTYPTAVEAKGNIELATIAARSLFGVAESYFRLEYYAQAIENWETLVAQYPQSELSPTAQFQIGETYFQANHFDEAKTAFQSVRQDFGDRSLAATSTLRLAQCAFNAGNYEEALPLFNEYIESYPETGATGDALEGMQLCYYQLGQAEQASDAFQKLIQQSPNGMLAADARLRLAQSFLELHEPEQAVTAFKEILTLYPGTSYARDAQLALAKTYLAQQDYRSANEEFSRYLAYFPDGPEIPEVLFELGAGYFKLESYVSASDYFQQVVKDFSGTAYDGPALQNLGWCFDRLGENERALQCFESYLAENPTAEDVRRIQLQVARIKAELGFTDEAIRILRPLNLSDDTRIATEASYRLGAIYRKMKQWRPAKAFFSTAIRRGEKDDYYRLSAISELAAVYEARQDWTNAVATYQMLAKSAPEAMWASAAEERINALTPMISH